LLVALIALAFAAAGDPGDHRCAHEPAGWDYYQDKATTDYGLARTATLIKRRVPSRSNSLLFDNGDLLQGNPAG
jgi:2',3'-cyclic-nucleotide 2'-phosphodiesterase (5'-nucleotidase family)